MNATDYSTLPAVPLAGVEPRTICVRRNGSVCRLTDSDNQFASFDSGSEVWSDTGRHSKCAESHRDIVRTIRETPLPDGWRVAEHNGESVAALKPQTSRRSLSSRS